MPRKTEQSGEWDFQVEPQELLLSNGSKSNVWANVRTDTGKAIGVISKSGYGLIQNRDFIGTIRSSLQSLGLDDYSEKIMVTNGGSRLFAQYDFMNRVYPIHKVGDQVGLVLRFSTSHDCTLAARAESAAKILRCLNGMCGFADEFSLQQRHTSRIEIGFVQRVIENSVDKFDDSLQVFGQLADVNITDAQGINILGHLGLAERTAQKVANIWIQPSFAESKGRSLYWLYDAISEHLRDQEAERYEHTWRSNQIALRRLSSALNPAVFAEYIKSPEKQEAIEVATV